MDKQTTFAFVLIGLILIIWLYFNSPEPTPPEKSKKEIVNKDSSTSSKKDSLLSEKESTNTTLLNSTQSLDFAPSSAPESIITIENDFVKLELTSKGARIRRYFLKEFKTWYGHNANKNDFYKEQVQLVNTAKSGGDFNVIFVTRKGEYVNTKNLDFTSNANNYQYKIDSKDSLSLVFEYQSPTKNIIKKNFKFYGNDYQFKVDIELENMKDIISSYSYNVEWGDGINFVEDNSVDEATYSSASAYSGDEQVLINATNIGEKVSKDINGKVDWIAVRNKYFGVIISPLTPSENGGAFFNGSIVDTKYGNREFYSASLKIPFNESNYQKDAFNIYFGPLKHSKLQSYNKNYEAIYDWGSFFGLRFINKPISEYILLPLFTFLHSFIPNYGFVIIIFSLIIKVALHPLSRQSLKSMRKMQLLQPKMTELKEKYKDDPSRVQKETMKLYQTYGINPAGGCLPMLLQMPILFALFTFFSVSIEIRQQPFILWITNLSSPDVISKLSFSIPLFNVTQISGLAPLLGVTMFIQQKMSVKDPSQKALIYVMPVMFTLMFMGFSSGLNLYYLMFNVLSIIQQYYVNHHKTEGNELVPVPVTNKKKGFMARIMEAAEKQSEAQKQAQKKRK